MSAHTEGDLKQDANFPYHVLDAAGMSVASAHGRTLEQARANASHLALCWNTHPELVEALTKLEKSASEVARHGAIPGSQWVKMSTDLLLARALLARIQETKS
ncbi:hypothetical protein [Amorphus sp. MBR-141]